MKELLIGIIFLVWYLLVLLRYSFFLIVFIFLFFWVMDRIWFRNY